MIMNDRRLFLGAFVAVSACAAVPARAATPPADFLSAAFHYRTDPNQAFLNAGLTLAELIAATRPGVWESAAAGWIYRVVVGDELTGDRTNFAYLFERLAPGAVGLTGGALNGVRQDVANTYLLIRPVLIQAAADAQPFRLAGGTHAQQGRAEPPDTAVLVHAVNSHGSAVPQDQMRFQPAGARLG